VRVRCDVVAVATLPAPASELARQHGATVRLDAAAGGVACVTDDSGATSVPSVFACGDLRGYRGPAAAAARLDGERTGTAAATSLPS
jgi:sarcosine oxidase, subunit alpha